MKKKVEVLMQIDLYCIGLEGTLMNLNLVEKNF